MIFGLKTSLVLTYWIMGFVLITPVLFVLAAYIYRYFDSILARILYVVSSYMGGIFLNWFFASIIMALVFALSYFIVDSYIFQISVFLYSVATALAFIGFYQSFKLKVIKYSVSTPKQYKDIIGKNFVLVADTHLGPIHQEFFARRLFRKIIDQNPTAVLFSGDMFDSELYKDVDKIKKEIKNLTSKMPVFFTPGNHEQYGPYNHFIEIITDGGMTVLSDEAIRFLGVPIFGLNFKQIKKMDEIEKLINSSIFKEHPSIVLNHEPVFHDLLEKAGAFLVVSGHTHNGQFWPGNYIANLFYGKYTYGLQKLRGLTSITTGGAGTFGSPIRTFNRPEIVVIEFE